MNWKKFELKYDKRETWAFEQMAYLLFCSEFNNRIGIFRYKNQAGIETNPIEHDGKLIGFQAKYYTNSISESKDDIIDSIRKAKSKNPKLTDVFFYVNQELSESSKKNEKAPKYQKEIEKVSSGEGIAKGLNDLLMQTLGTPEHPGRVRALGYDIIFYLLHLT